MRTALLSAFLLCSAASASAQRPLEFGVDAVVGIGVGDRGANTISIPNGLFRVAFPVSQRLSLEPRFSYNRADVDDIGAVTVWRFEGSGLINLSGTSRNSLFLRPSTGIDYAAAGDSDSFQPVLGLSLGKKVAINSTMSGRFEVGYEYGVANDGFPESQVLLLSAGFSFFSGK